MIRTIQIKVEVENQEDFNDILEEVSDLVVENALCYGLKSYNVKETTPRHKKIKEIK